MSILFELAPQLAWLIPLLPLLAAAGIALRILTRHDQGDDAEPPTARIALFAASAALLLLLGLDFIALSQGLPGHVRSGIWFSSGAIVLPISFTLDALSLPIATLVAFIATITLLFSRNYLHRERGFHRFFLAMCLFIAGMLLIVLAGNVALTFVGWELAGVSSWMSGFAVTKAGSSQLVRWARNAGAYAARVTARIAAMAIARSATVTFIATAT